jgi:hypothetical protein
MGITPISSLLPLSVARAMQADLDPLPMARVENSPRAGDETYSPSGGQSARGSEDDLDDFADEADQEIAVHPRAAGRQLSISFFA